MTLPAELTLAGIMSRHVQTVTPDRTVRDAVRLMAEKRISCLVVEEHRRPIGIITERDVVRLLHERADTQAPIATVMSAPVITVRPDTGFGSACDRMLECGVRHLVICDDEDVIVGVISETDVRLHIGLDQFRRMRTLSAVMDRDIPSLPLQRTLADALATMVTLHWDYIIITDAERPVGILTERDMPRLLTSHGDPATVPLQAAMLGPIETVPVTQSVPETLELMAERGYRHMPVTDDGIIVGVITQHRLLEQLSIESLESDLAKQRALAQSLAHERARLATLVQTIPDLVWLKDPDGVYLFANAVTERTMGLPEGSMEGKTDHDFFPAEIAEFLRAKDQEAIAAGTPSATDEQVTMPNGTTMWLHTTKTPMHDSEGRLIGVLGLARDVTSSRDMQWQLTERVKEMRCLYNVFRETERQNVTAEEMLNRVAELLPSAMQFADDAVARIVFDGTTRSTDRFAPRQPMLVANFTARDREGCVAVTYLSKHPEADEGPYLQEERDLVDAVAARLGSAIVRFLEAEELIASEARLQVALAEQQTMLNNGIVGIVRVRDRRFLWANRAFEQVLGYDPGELNGKSSRIIFPDDASYAALEDAYEVLAHGKVWRGQVQYRRKDGELRWFDLSGGMLPDGDSLWSLVDITNAKASEAALIESEARYRSMVDALGEGVVVYDTSGRIRSCNRAATLIFGSEESALIGLHANDPSWVMIHRDMSPCPPHEMPMIRALAGRDERNVELGLRRGDGRLVWLSINATAVYDSRSEPASAVVSFSDISERVLAERRLQESETALREAQAIAHVGSWTLYMPTDNLRWSPETYRIFGIPESTKITMHTADTSVHPEDRTRVAAAWQAALAGGDYDIEHRIVVGNQVRWVRERAQLRRNADGEAYYAVGTIQDITGIKTALEDLRRSEARARAVIESSPIPMAINDEHGNLIYLNPAFSETFGYTLTDIPTLAQWWDRAFPNPLYQHHVMTEWQARAERAVQADGRFEPQEIDVVCKDGGVRHVLASGAPMEKSATPLLLVILYDMTERRAFEDQLRKLSLAVEQSPNGILVTDTQGRIEYANDALIAISGYRREQLIGNNPRVLQSGRTPRERYDELWQALQQGESWQGEFVNLRPDGTEYIEFARISPVRQPDGEITHYLAIKEDITERKRIGAELDRHRHHLEDMVTEKTAELALAKHAAEEASRAKSAFLANMSHEIRTPMNAIIGLAHIAHRHADEPAQRERLKKVEEAARHLLSIINDILDISKIEAGKLTLEDADLELAQVIGSALALIEDRAAAKGLRLSVDVDASLSGRLRGDPLRLGQILVNFAGNAVKFTEQGSITIRAMPVTEDDQGLTVRIEVSDTGIGIAPADQERLFNAFEQADSSTTRRFGGTGLGLAICRRLVDAMGGTIGVESRLGEGSTFWFTLRMTRAGAARPHEARAAAEQEVIRRYRGTRILLVEDNPVNQDVALELLRGAGLTADLAENGAKALTRVLNGNYALVLMDMQMPILDGIEATEAIRRLPDCAQLPIIAMSANVFPEDRQRCLSAGMNDHLAKPIDPDVLFATLLRWLPASPAAAPAPSPAAAPSAKPPQNLDEASIKAALGTIPGLDSERGLASVRGRVASFARLLTKFAESHRGDITLLREAYSDGRREEARRIAHSLKGAAGTLGIGAIQASAASLEAAIKNQDKDAAIASGAEVLEHELGAFLSALAAALPTAKPVAAAPATVDLNALSERLNQLRSLLREDDFRAQSVWLDINLQAAAVFGARAGRIAQLLADFSFDAALAELDAAIAETPGLQEQR